jgi:hypothetical protein
MYVSSSLAALYRKRSPIATVPAHTPPGMMLRRNKPFQMTDADV